MLQNFCAYTERQFNKPVKVVRSDNGSEFMCLSSYFNEKGIIHQTSCVATPQQNGRVERKHRHILNIARALLFQAGLPIKFWGEAISTATHLINLTPSKVLNGLTPHEALFGQHHRMSISESLVPLVMFIEMQGIRISLELGVDIAYLLDTLLARKVGGFMYREE